MLNSMEWFVLHLLIQNDENSMRDCKFHGNFIVKTFVFKNDIE